MKLPLFYNAALLPADTSTVLDEVTSKHIIQVLRMGVHEQLHITDGKGNLYLAEIIDDNRKRCGLNILSVAAQPRAERNVIIAISPVKNHSRFEWFVEKATEIAVGEIVPLICQRTEKSQFKLERLHNIVISAMLQSQQVWLPTLHETVKFETYINKIKAATHTQQFIAHCESQEIKRSLSEEKKAGALQRVILIGPEGDFTRDEIDKALQCGFVPVALGNTRLRTETAGIVAATLLNED